MGRLFSDLGSGFCLGASLLVLLGAAPEVARAQVPTTTRPDDAQVYFIAPADGEIVSSPFVVRFGLRAMGVAPAGVEKAGTGHHHLIVDAELPPSGLPIPKNDHYLHFGNGQTEVTLELEPGDHTLQLLLGDHIHVPHDRAVRSERISITVKE